MELIHYWRRVEGGRFLAQEAGLWIDVEDKKVRAKTSQLLREKERPAGIESSYQKKKRLAAELKARQEALARGENPEDLPPVVVVDGRKKKNKKGKEQKKHGSISATKEPERILSSESQTCIDWQWQPPPDSLLDNIPCAPLATALPLEVMSKETKWEEDLDGFTEVSINATPFDFAPAVLLPDTTTSSGRSSPVALPSPTALHRTASDTISIVSAATSLPCAVEIPTAPQTFDSVAGTVMGVLENDQIIAMLHQEAADGEFYLEQKKLAERMMEDDCKPSAVARKLKVDSSLTDDEDLKKEKKKAAASPTQHIEMNLKTIPSLAAASAPMVQPEPLPVACGSISVTGLPVATSFAATIPVSSIPTAVSIPTSVASVASLVPMATSIETTTPDDASQLIEVLGYCFEDSSGFEQAGSRVTLATALTGV